MQNSDNNSYLDARSPVFRTQGTALVDELFSTKQSGKTQEHHFALYIRNKVFAGEELDKMNNLRQFNGKEVVIEFSPKTRHIWRLYETTDI